MMEALHCVKLYRRWHNHLLLLVFSPSYLPDQFDFVHNHHHLTRNHTSNTLIVPKFNTNSGKHTFYLRVAYAWYNLPTEVRMDFDNMSVQQLFKYKMNEIWLYLFKKILNVLIFVYEYMYAIL